MIFGLPTPIAIPLPSLLVDRLIPENSYAVLPARAKGVEPDSKRASVTVYQRYVTWVPNDQVDEEGFMREAYPVFSEELRTPWRAVPAGIVCGNAHHRSQLLSLVEADVKALVDHCDDAVLRTVQMMDPPGTDLPDLAPVSTWPSMRLIEGFSGFIFGPDKLGTKMVGPLAVHFNSAQPCNEEFDEQRYPLSCCLHLFFGMTLGKSGNTMHQIHRLRFDSKS